MVTSAINIADLLTEVQENTRFGIVYDLKREFIARRENVQENLADIKRYFSYFNNEGLRGQILLFNGLAIEASKLDDQYRLYSHLGESDPIYQQLMVMYNGMRNLIRREVRHREMHSSGVE